MHPELTHIIDLYMHHKIEMAKTNLGTCRDGNAVESNLSIPHFLQDKNGTVLKKNITTIDPIYGPIRCHDRNRSLSKGFKPTPSHLVMCRYLP